MGRKRLKVELFAYMNGEKVGTLTRTANGRLKFSYDKSWLKSSSGRPLSLSMPLAEEVYTDDKVENWLVSRICGNIQVPVTCQVHDIRRFVGISEF